MWIGLRSRAECCPLRWCSQWTIADQLPRPATTDVLPIINKACWRIDRQLLIKAKIQLTRTCQTFSLAPSNEQKRILTPNNPCPPQLLLGVIFTSRTVCCLLLYTVIVISLLSLVFSSSFSVSLSWSKRMWPMATIKSKNASNPAFWPGESSCT